MIMMMMSGLKFRFFGQSDEAGDVDEDENDDVSIMSLMTTMLVLLTIMMIANEIRVILIIKIVTEDDVKKHFSIDKHVRSNKYKEKNTQ